MRLIRFLFKVVLLIFLFILGVSAADKEYLSDRIVGVQILGADSEWGGAFAENVQLFLEGSEVENAEELCALLQESGLLGQDAQAFCTSAYFERSLLEDRIIPAGIYDAVCIQLGSGQEQLTCFVKQTGTISTRFRSAEDPFFSQIQGGYLAFLSFLGNIEKIVIYFKDIL